jgi:hypothetical protein
MGDVAAELSGWLKLGVSGVAGCEPCVGVVGDCIGDILNVERRLDLSICCDQTNDAKKKGLPTRSLPRCQCQAIANEWPLLQDSCDARS